MNKRIYLLLVVFGLMIFFTACGSPTNDMNSAGNSAQSSPGQYTVIIKNFKFEPEKLEIKKGETVTWINQDSAVHTATGKSFDSGNLSKGDKFSFTFQDTGVFDYICTPHPYMKASVSIK